MQTAERITVKDAANILHISQSFIRTQLQKGNFDFGQAIKSNRGFKYILYKDKVLRYAGILQSSNPASNLEIERLEIAPNYIAYEVRSNVLRWKLDRLPECDMCGESFRTLHLVATEDKCYCDECFNRYRDRIKHFSAIDPEYVEEKRKFYETKLKKTLL